VLFYITQFAMVCSTSSSAMADRPCKLGDSKG